MIHQEYPTAVAAIRRLKPDLVILDMNAGDPEDGWAVLDGLRLDPALAHLPVIICSAHTAFLKEHAAKLKEEGCCLVEKPFSVHDMLLLVEEAITAGSSACREQFAPLPRSSASSVRH